MTDRIPHPAPGDDVPTPPLDEEVESALALLGLGDGAGGDASDDSAARELLALATAGVALADLTSERIVPVMPPPGLRSRLLDRIRQEQRFQFVRADEGQWTPTDGDPAAREKLLYQGPRPGDRTRLLRLRQGDVQAALADAHDPALLVVDGELRRGDTRCTPGDFAQATPGDAPTWMAATPATVLVVERGGAEVPDAVPRRRVPVVPAGREGWRPIAAGTRVRPLAGGPGESVDLMLLEMDAGGLLPDHEHGGLEEIFLLRGSCRCQGRSLSVGDYHRAAHGSEHEETTTDVGCLMLVVLRKAA